MKLINQISRLIFQVRYKSDKHKQFRSFITNFYDYYNENEYSFNSYRITKCRFYDFPKTIVIEIHSLSPGMIIGKHGQCIDRFKEFMQKRYCKPIKIDLQETNPFK